MASSRTGAVALCTKPQQQKDRIARQPYSDHTSIKSFACPYSRLFARVPSTWEFSVRHIRGQRRKPRQLTTNPWSTPGHPMFFIPTSSETKPGLAFLVDHRRRSGRLLRAGYANQRQADGRNATFQQVCMSFHRVVPLSLSRRCVVMAGAALWTAKTCLTATRCV